MIVSPNPVGEYVATHVKKSWKSALNTLVSLSSVPTRPLVTSSSELNHSLNVALEGRNWSHLGFCLMKPSKICFHVKRSSLVRASPVGLSL